MGISDGQSSRQMVIQRETKALPPVAALEGFCKNLDAVKH
jgi:hypothetical protein